MEAPLPPGTGCDARKGKRRLGRRVATRVGGPKVPRPTDGVDAGLEVGEISFEVDEISFEVDGVLFEVDGGSFEVDALLLEVGDYAFVLGEDGADEVLDLLHWR